MKKDFKLIALVICFFCIGFVMLLLVARWRIYTGWSMVIEDALSNELLKNEIGNVKKVSFSNYFKVDDSYNNVGCVKINAKTELGKYKLCAFLQKDPLEERLVVSGYRINNEYNIFNLPEFNLFDYEEKINNFENVDLKLGNLDYFVVMNFVDEYFDKKNTYDLVFFDKINKAWLYETEVCVRREPKREYIKKYIIVSSEGKLLAEW